MIRFGLALAGLVVVLDQLTKWWMVAVVLDPPLPVLPFLNLVLVHNRGASFGILNNDSVWVPWLLTGFAAVISVALVVWLARASGRWLGTAIGLILGGAVGNMIDRVRLGAVVDFIDVFAGRYHWPAFNVADSAITLGVVALLIDSLIVRGSDRTVSVDRGENHG